MPRDFRNARAIRSVPVSTTVPTDGQALVYNAATGLYVPTDIAGGGGGWTNIYTVDYSALPTGGSVVMPAGAAVIDGKNWYVENPTAANEMRIVNGEGLVIDPNATSTDWFGNTRTAPIFSTLITELAPEWTLADEFRIWIMFSTSGIDANFEFADFCIENHRWIGGSWGTFTARGYDSGQKWAFRFDLGGATSTQLDSTAGYLANDVICLRFTRLWYIESYTGTSVGGNFPAFDTLTLRASQQYGASAAVTMLETTIANGLGFAFGVQTVNTLNSVRAAIQKLSIDTK